MWKAFAKAGANSDLVAFVINSLRIHKTGSCMLTMLCNVCQEIFKGDREFFSDNFDFVWHEHYQTVGELQNSALGGCHICASCWSEVSHNSELSCAIETSTGQLSDVFFTRYSLSEAGMYAPEGSYELLISFAVDGVEEVAQRQFVIESAQAGIAIFIK